MKWSFRKLQVKNEERSQG